MSAVLLALAAPSLAFVAGTVALLRRRGPSWLRGLGWVGAWSAPAAVIQVAIATAKGTGEPVWELPFVLLTSWWVLGGGGVCVWFFETSLAAEGVGRQFTMLDHGGYFLGLVALWCGALAAVSSAFLERSVGTPTAGAPPAGTPVDGTPPASGTDSSESSNRPGTGSTAGERSSRRPAVVVGVVVLANAFAAIGWPWWGA